MWLFYWFYSLEIQALIIYYKEVFIKSFIIVDKLMNRLQIMGQRLVG